MATVTVGILGLVALLVLLLIGVPIAASMAIIGIAGYGVLSGFGSSFKLLSMDLFSSIASYNMSVVSMFTFMGYLALHSGIGSKLYEFAYKLMGHLPGGMAIASEGACAAFGAICGSGPATVSTIGSIALPEMRRYRYDDSLATASIAAGGGLGLLIPPSITAIVYGIMTEQSIGRLFIGGISVGVLLMLLFMTSIYILTRRNPALAPKGRKATWKERAEAMSGGLVETAIIFIVSIGGLSVGWFTPTEGGAMGAFAVLVVCLIRKKLSLKAFLAALTDTAKTIGMVVFLVSCATSFSRFLAISKIPTAIAESVGGLALPSFGIMLIILLIYLVAGCFVDALPLIMLTVPIFYPIVVKIGYDPVWFGVVITLVCCMGMITPPVGVNAYVAKGVAKDVPLEVVFKGVWPFFLAQLICLMFCLLVPQFVLFLPNVLT
jgi:tripartite ATP-independent transporter DctM subunit